MHDAANGSSSYRVEVSGWGLYDSFFVEKTELLWTRTGEKKLLLRHCLSDGAIVFVRLLGNDTVLGSVPVAYQVENVQPMNRLGLCEMRLEELHPRAKSGARREGASRAPRNPLETEEARKDSMLTDTEEILHEA